jgi:hypothetical protein
MEGAMSITDDTDEVDQWSHAIRAAIMLLLFVVGVIHHQSPIIYPHLYPVHQQESINSRHRDTRYTAQCLLPRSNISMIASPESHANRAGLQHRNIVNAIANNNQWPILRTDN